MTLAPDVISGSAMNGRTLTVALALAIAGCGGSGTEAEPADDTSAGGEEHAHHDEHHSHDEAGHAEEHHHGEEPHDHTMSAELRAFHDVLAPVYHMDPGAERAQASCDAAAQLTSLAPDVSEDAVGAVATLTTTCEAEELDAAAAEENLEGVHDAFHHAMEAWQAEHAE